MATPAQRLIQDENLNIIYHGTTPGGKIDVAKKADKRRGPGRRKPLSNISNSGMPSVLHSVKKNNSINVLPIEKDSFAVKTKLSKAPERGKVGGRKPSAGGKADGDKADERGGPGRRKPLSNISNSGTPSVLHSVKKDNAVKTKVSKAPVKGKVGGRKPLGELTKKPPSEQVPNMGRKLNAVAEENISLCRKKTREERLLHNHEECIKAWIEEDAMRLNALIEECNYNGCGARSDLEILSKPENTMKHFEVDDDDDDDYEMPDSYEDEVLRCRKSELSDNCSPSYELPPSPEPWFMSCGTMSWDDSELRLIATPELTEHLESSSF